MSREEHQQQQDPIIIIIDGGMGRELERQGAPFRQPEWSALALYEAPEIVRRVHASFVAAGAEYITTNTYAIVPFHLGEERYRKDGKRLLQLAVELAKESLQEGVKILGSIPPICGSYEPDKFRSDISKPIVNEFLDAFVTGGVDTILLETLGSIEEATCYLSCIDERQIEMPVWVSYCLSVEEGFDKQPTLLSGETLSSAMEAALRQCTQIEAVLVNCCDMRLVSAALKEAQTTLDKQNNQRIRLGAYPNAFSIPPPDAANHSLRQVDYNISPAVLEDRVNEWFNEGTATILGGCCGVSPEHISCLAKWKKRVVVNAAMSRIEGNTSKEKLIK